jgi:hypothetical protein
MLPQVSQQRYFSHLMLKTEIKHNFDEAMNIEEYITMDPCIASEMIGHIKIELVFMFSRFYLPPLSEVDDVICLQNIMTHFYLADQH